MFLTYLISSQAVDKLLEAGKFPVCLGLCLFDQGVVAVATAQEGHRVDHVGHRTGCTPLVVAILIPAEFLFAKKLLGILYQNCFLILSFCLLGF